MAETTIPKDWAEVRAAVNLVERGVKVIIIFIISRAITIVITIIIIIIVILRGRRCAQASSATAVKDTQDESAAEPINSRNIFPTPRITCYVRPKQILGIM